MAWHKVSALGVYDANAAGEMYFRVAARVGWNSKVRRENDQNRSLLNI